MLQRSYCYLYFCAFFLGFLYPGDSIAKPGVNSLFKNVKNHLEAGEKKEALYLLRNQSLELVGTDKEMAHFAQGVLGIEEGDFIEGRKKLASVESLKEILAPYIQYYKALSFFKEGKVTKAEKNLKSFFSEKHSQEELLEKGLYLQGKIDLKNKKALKALKSLNPLLRKWRGKAKKEVLLTELLEAALVDKVFSRGKYCFWFRDLYSKYPSASVAKSWSLDEKTIAFKDKDIDCEISFKDKKKRLRTLYLEGLNKKILQELNSLTSKEHEREKRRLTSYFYYLSGSPQKAISVIKDYLEEDYEDATYLATLKYYSGKPEAALGIYKKLFEKEQISRRKISILNRIGKYNIELKNYEISEMYFQKILNDFPKSRYRIEAEWNLAWARYLGERYQEAYTAFTKILSNMKDKPNSYRRLDADKVLYWSARALQKSGQDHLSVNVYKDLVEKDANLSYYAILSALRLKEIAEKHHVFLSQEHFLKIPWKKQSPQLASEKNKFLERMKLASRMPSSLSIGLSPSGIHQVDLEENFPDKPLELKKLEESEYALTLERFKYLSRVGFWREAGQELVLVSKLAKTKELKKKLLSLFESIENYEHLSKLATLSFYGERQSEDKDLSYFYWTKAYPRAFEKDVNEAEGLFKIPAHLIWSVMRAESFFDPQIVSPVGARGLLQVMPFTGAKVMTLLSGQSPVGLKLTYEEQEKVSQKLFLPEVNIKTGGRYLKRLEKQFLGHLPFIVASYNGGPHRVKLWSMKFGSIEQDEFTERVPFSETKKYIKKVLRNLFVYQSLYSDEKIDMSFLVEPIPFKYTGPLPTAEYWGEI